MLNASVAVADLIDSIYETIEQPERWHSVFEQLIAYLEFNHITPACSLTPISLNAPSFLEQVAHHPLLKVMSSVDGLNLEQLALHIRRALQLRHALMQRIQHAETGVRLLDAIGSGILIVRLDGEVAYINPAARQILNSNIALSLKANRIWSPNPSKYRRLQFFIADMVELSHMSASQPLERHLAIQHQNDVLYLHLSLVSHETDSLPWMSQQLMKEPMVMLHIRDLKQGLSFNTRQQLVTIYQLSKAELNIACLVADGLQVSDISELLQLSANTIRAQLKAIYKKTNTSRQSELIQLILRFEQ